MKSNDKPSHMLYICLTNVIYNLVTKPFSAVMGFSLMFIVYTIHEKKVFVIIMLTF